MASKIDAEIALGAARNVCIRRFPDGMRVIQIASGRFAHVIHPRHRRAERFRSVGGQFLAEPANVDLRSADVLYARRIN